MGNIIKIKHGEDIPDGNDLLPYELGYLTGNGGGRLYVGDTGENDSPITMQIGRKVFIQSTAPTSGFLEGDLWVLIEE